ncbi:MAG: alpha/beta hydrolase [Deltaproteobacteria bacterium]|nr:alpha/beta hydrolase [Deltaproteobacteria bacterium]
MNTATPAWMGEVDLAQIGFPFAVEPGVVHKTPGLTYKTTPLGPLQLDAYRPAAEGPHPLVVMIHGGGWRQGGRYQMGLTKWAAYLAAGGLAVVSIDYRLAPHTTYPDSFQDCLDAVDWAVEHADALGADASRVGLWGDSAGGHLALLLATSQTAPRYDGPRLRHGAERLRAVAALYPPTDLLALHSAEQPLGTRTVANFVGAEPSAAPERWRAASPIEHVHAGLPPILLLQGTRDLLVPDTQARRFAARLAEHGTPHRLEIVEGGVHGFDRIAPTERAKTLIADTRDFLRQHLTAE